VTGNDKTNASEVVTIPSCPTWVGVRGGKAAISAARHQLLQKINNARNKSSVTVKVRRSHLPTLQFRIKGESSRTLSIGLHRHGATKLTFKVGSHRLFTGTIRLP
jgi:hypothetical protein